MGFLFASKAAPKQEYTKPLAFSCYFCGHVILFFCSARQLSRNLSQRLMGSFCDSCQCRKSFGSAFLRPLRSSHLWIFPRFSGKAELVALYREYVNAEIHALMGR